ncbi:unnamed protein product [Phaedon cochleariae]|uniref:Tubulin-specific chaperone D n=1 Tax=Phaedon cochleariae TaxID=80249 RepID=A0A9P0DPK7_PHACE|nr:unnamed protein product [Phaedon cochleariae]
MRMPVNGQNHEPPKEEEPFGLGCALEYFAEHEEVFGMIDNLTNIAGSETNVIEKAYEKFNFILSQYIEQPHLIDSHINVLLEKFIVIVRSNDSPMELKHLAFKFMFVVVNVRGYKVIVRHLPHEVGDFEPVLQLLERQDPSDPETWTTRYILLLWLSIIVIIPFHMSRFDGFDNSDEEKKTVMDRVLTIIKTYAVVSDKCRDAAAYLAHKFITRNDVKEKHLSTILEWVKELSLSENSNVFVKYGTLACVATILKHGKREDLLPYARNLLEWIVNAEFRKNSGSNIQKLVYKIIQRIGLTFLPPRIASWRYKRGNRSLAANLSSGDGSVASAPKECKEEVENDEEIEVPDEVEDVIDQLIEGLRCLDGVVRWSAAKGIGRVTGRLPKELADDVVGSILETFSPRETDSAWHGGCLALAELGRRGLLLPDRLPQVVPVVMKALVYDEPKGYASVGSHIRDAACFVCWAFSRAYDSEVLAPHVQEISSSLLVVTCFDKEINCRRAASAAFQENVGRQGNFPHGIEILTVADFFSVSVRNSAYLTISTFIAQFEQYRRPLIDHLLKRKVDHWDTSIRELTAKAFHNLTPTLPSYLVDTVLPSLFEKSISIDLNSRHGSVLAIGEILYALSKIAKERNQTIDTLLTEDLLTKTKNLVPIFRERLYFRGLGGELMKQACSDFIEKCSLAALPFHKDDVIEDWLQLLTECFSYEVAVIRAAAVKALPTLLSEYYVAKPDRCDAIVKTFNEELLSHSNEHTRMGFGLALGCLPKFVLLGNFDEVVSALMEASKITPNTAKWAESRRDSVKALSSVSRTMAENLGKEFSEDHVDKIYGILLEGLKDYTQDKRGDIGAWTREACVLGLQTLTFLLSENRPEMLNEDLLNRILSGVAQQAVEKIDRTRALAGRVFYSIIYHDPRIQNIAHQDDLCRIFPKEECDLLNWNSASSTFPKFVQLVQLPSYSYNLMLGLVCSIGGMTENLVKNSSSSLFAYLKTVDESKGSSEIRRICDIVLKLFTDHQKVDRITIPMFRFLDKLFDSGCIDCMVKDSETEFFKKILRLIQAEISACKDIYKLIDGITVLCQLIQAWPYFLLFMVLENVILWSDKKHDAYRLNDGLTSLSHGLIQHSGKLLFRGGESFMYFYLYEKFRLVNLPWDTPLTWYLAAVGVDFCYYWVHRACHEVHILWAQHQVHHSSEEFNLAVGLRQSLVQGWCGFIFYLPLAFFIPPAHFITHQQFNLLYQFWIHTKTITTLGPLEYIFNTPQHHRVHHGSNIYCLDKNYGGVFIIWDRIFGTFASEKQDEEIIYGLVYNQPSFNPLHLQTFYTEYVIDKFKSMQSWRYKLAAVFYGPSWQPGKPRLGLEEDKIKIVAREKYDVKLPVWCDIYLLAHFCVVVYGFQQLAAQHMSMNPFSVLAFVIYIIASLTTIGMLFDNCPYACAFELLRCTLLVTAIQRMGFPDIDGAVLFSVEVFFMVSGFFWFLQTIKVLQISTKLKSV